MDACFVCEKHRNGDRAPGGVLHADDLVYAGHGHALGDDAAYRGHLVIEPLRHVAGLGDLTDDEAAALGALANRLARALKDVAGAVHVYAFVIGDAVPHLHLQLVPRYPGTPREHWGPRLLQWAEAPRVDEPAMRRRVVHLRGHLQHANLRQ